MQLTKALNLSLGAVNAMDKYPMRSIADISYLGNFPYDVLSPVGLNGAYCDARARLTF